MNWPFILTHKEPKCPFVNTEVQFQELEALQVFNTLYRACPLGIRDRVENRVGTTPTLHESHSLMEKADIGDVIDESNKGEVLGNSGI